MFRDSETALRARERIENLTGLELQSFFERAFAGNPSPDIALTNLERWLNATSSPSLHMQQIAGVPPLGKMLIDLFGSSQPIADTLIQNPELASVILEPGAIRDAPTRELVVEEGKKLLQSATSYLHSLDRLRFLRQRWNLQIVVNDISGAWAQPVVWLALSEVADALIELAAQVAWKEFTKVRPTLNYCPVMIVSFGKLAGQELNYSSDIDLVYVAEDGLDQRVDRELTKFCESLTRALSDRMGRGSLYRVDLRLRPYGASGPILRSMRAVEAYYKLYAEPWEVQALIRSRPVLGPMELQTRWVDLRTTHSFKPNLSEMALEQMLSMRESIEARADSDDLKRGSGGIRDVEFLVQILQLLHGHQYADLQGATTLKMLTALEAHGILEHADVASLGDGYTFLRRLEHRVQLLGDRQTHTIPEDGDAREVLARLTGYSSFDDLDRALTARRRTISALYSSILNLDLPHHQERTHIQAALGAHGPAALQWFDVLPHSDAFYEALIRDQDSLDRVRKVLVEAPKLLPRFKESVALTEMLVSGEIEGQGDFRQKIDALPLDAPPRMVADTYGVAQAITIVQWLLYGQPHHGAETGPSLAPALTELADALILHCCRRLYATFDVIALGSLGTFDFGPGSDADILLLVEDPALHADAEQQAQFLLSLVAELRRLGAPIELDLRLRPDGGKGMLARTYAGLRAYDLEGMEMWERFALGHGRMLTGNPEGLRTVMHSAYGLPLTPERLKELLRMKRRIETERVKPQHVRRNVKLGFGGLSDIEWLVHLHEMRYPTALKAGAVTKMPDRVRLLGRTGLINALEVGLLLEAYDHLSSLRMRLYLMGMTEDLVPENPDKLDRLALVTGFPEGNEFLARHERIIETVRRLYQESLERLRG